MLIQILNHVGFMLKDPRVLLLVQPNRDLIDFDSPGPSMTVLNDHPIVAMVLTEFQHVNAVGHHQRSNICFIVVIMY